MTDTNCAALNYLIPAKKHDQVKHIGLGTCDWTKRLKPLLTTSTTTTTYKATQLLIRQSKGSTTK